MSTKIYERTTTTVKAVTDVKIDITHADYTGEDMRSNHIRICLPNGRSVYVNILTTDHTFGTVYYHDSYDNGSVILATIDFSDSHL